VSAGGAVRSAGQAATVTELVTGLVPHASVVIDEYLRRALHRHIQDAIQQQLDDLMEHGHAVGSGDDADG
jgi:hypothetical protein